MFDTRHIDDKRCKWLNLLMVYIYYFAVCSGPSTKLAQPQKHHTVLWSGYGGAQLLPRHRLEKIINCTCSGVASIKIVANVGWEWGERVCGVRVGQKRERECVWWKWGKRERERVCVCGPIHKYHVLFHQVVVVRDENILYFGKVLINTSKAQSIRSKVDLFCGKTVYKNIFCLLVMILQQTKKKV